MSGPELLIEFSIHQNRLLEVLEGLDRSAERFSNNFKHFSFESARHQIDRLQEHLKKEAGHFTQWALQPSLRHSSIYSHLEKITLQVQQLTQSLSPFSRNSSAEECLFNLDLLKQKIEKIQTELKNIDLRSTFAPVADAILINRLEGLGRPQVLQWPRKIYHILSALIIASIYLFVPLPFLVKIGAFACFTIAAIAYDIRRLLRPEFNARVVKRLQKYMRKREINHFNSMTFYAISTFLVCLLFPKGIALLSVLFLGIGDSAASIVGIQWGRHKYGRFSIEGSLAFFLSCFALSFLYPLWDPTFHGPIWLFALCGGLIGMLSERCFPKLDDNLVIPLFSAVLLQILALFFHV